MVSVCKLSIVCVRKIFFLLLNSVENASLNYSSGCCFVLDLSLTNLLSFSGRSASFLNASVRASNLIVDTLLEFSLDV